MQRVKSILLLILLMSSANMSLGQGLPEYESSLSTATSEEGNYLYMWDIDGLRDSARFVQTDYFVVKRYRIGDKSTERIQDLNELLKRSKTIAKVRPARSKKEALSYFAKYSEDQLFKQFRLNDTFGFVELFNAKVHPGQYGFNYEMIEFQQALGHVYLDREVKKDEHYVYMVSRVDDNGIETPWGSAIVKAKVGNYIIENLHPKLSSIKTRDSLVSVRWQLPVGPEVLDSVPLPDNHKSFLDSSGRFYFMPFPPTSYRAKVTYRVADGETKHETLLCEVNEGQDTISFVFFSRMNPEDEFMAYLQLEDKLYNLGGMSDTAFAMAINLDQLPLIYSLDAESVTDAIELNWDAVPSKPYITGIELTRIDPDNNLDTLAILMPSDTTYTDVDLVPGWTYEYFARVLYQPYVNGKQEIAASAVSAYDKFSTPLAPYSLSAANMGEDIALIWKSDLSSSLYGFYVYRGIDQSNLDLIAGPVQDTTYVDSSQTLSGTSTYFYAVNARNLRQDSSEFSNVVAIQPNRRSALSPPGAMSFYVSNYALDLEWNDTRLTDNSVVGYVLERRTSQDTVFAPLTSIPITSISYKDTSFRHNLQYEYRLASIDFKGNQGRYSRTFKYILEPEEPKVDVITLFYARSTTDGIVIDLPMVQYSDRKQVNVFRRDASGGSFEMIGKLSSSEFSLVDDDVKEGVIYIYALQVVDVNGNSGALGTSKSIRYSKPASD